MALALGVDNGDAENNGASGGGVGGFVKNEDCEKVRDEDQDEGRNRVDQDGEERVIFFGVNWLSLVLLLLAPPTKSSLGNPDSFLLDLTTLLIRLSPSTLSATVTSMTPFDRCTRIWAVERELRDEPSTKAMGMRRIASERSMIVCPNMEPCPSRGASLQIT
mmetsp:Transcript_69826/g.137301  ORF Transcript_69826/g.137301 Transcript_69826/m.137301 type:complete len:162 (-) Transcript_69826:37-522(-)